MAETVKVSLGLVVDGFNVALKAAQSQTESFSKNAVSNFQFVEKSFAVMAGNLAASAFEKLASSIKEGFNHVIEEAGQSEDAINKLNIALKSAGLYSSASSLAMQEFAAGLQKTTIYSDEMILKSSSLLLSLTNLDQKGIQQATKAAANLAATLGIELSEATDMISKAINGNVTAFKKKGIVIQSADTDAQRLTNTLKALASQEGAAEAASNTYAGAIEKQKNQHSEVLEAIGKLITQNKLVKDSIDSSTASYAHAAEWITKNKKFIDDLTSTIIITTGVVAGAAAAFYVGSAAVAALGIAAATGTTAFGALGIAAGLAWAAITAPITLVVGGVALVGLGVYELVKHWEELKAAAYNAGAAILESLASNLKFFSPSMAKSMQDQAQAWRDKNTAIKESTISLVDAKREEDRIASEQTASKAARDKEELESLRRINMNKVEARRITNTTIKEIDAESDLALQEAEVAHLQTMSELTATFNADQLGKTLEQQTAILVARQKHETDLLNLQIEAEINKANLETDAKKRADDLRVINDKAQIEREKLKSKQILDIQKNQFNSEELIAKNKESLQKETYEKIATLASSNNHTLATIGKAAAITEIAIDTPVAISKALAAFPPPFNFAAAALVGTAMAAQAAQIAGVNFASGGIVPGSDVSGDRVRANLNSREMVLNQQQQAQLFNMANGASPSGADNSALAAKVDRLADALSNAQIIVTAELDGREIFKNIQGLMNSGRRFI